MSAALANASKSLAQALPEIIGAGCVRSFASSAAANAPDLSRFSRVGVVGSGQMGVGIAYVTAAVAKREVLLLDANPTQVEKGIAFIGGLRGKGVPAASWR